MKKKYAHYCVCCVNVVPLKIAVAVERILGETKNNSRALAAPSDDVSFRAVRASTNASRFAAVIMNSRFRDRESILHDRSRRRDVCKRYLTLALGERRLCENAAD